MVNNSASGGYLLPTSTTPIPGGLTFKQFIQTVLVGISGIAGTRVRPNWQLNPPKEPNFDVNWLAFGIAISNPDANAYVNLDESDVTHSQRHEQVEIACSFYGPDCEENAAIVRDGFQIQQNLAALKSAKMGYVETGPMIHIPDLVNERWVDRVTMSVVLRRLTLRVYPILTLVSAVGTIHTVLGNEEYLLDWQTREEDT